MRKILKLSFYAGLPYGTYVYYRNNIKSPPPDPKLQDKKNKKILVLGAGIVGLTTAYYLSQYEENDVTIVEKHMRCANECSIQNGVLMMRYNCAPWTYKPLLNVLRGIWRSDQPQAVYINKVIQEPALLKFAYYWLLLKDKLTLTKQTMPLNDAADKLYHKFLEETGIPPESFHFETNKKFLQVYMLPGFDLKKSYEQYMLTYRPFAEIGKEDTVYGNEIVREKYGKYFPSYKGLLKYNFALIQDIWTLNTRLFCEKVEEYLLKNRKNVKILYDHELDTFVFSEKEGEKHIVKAAKFKNRKEEIDFDLVVLCAGPFLSRVMKSNFGLLCPVLPVKGYSFDTKTDSPVSDYHLSFKDKAFVATHYDATTMRIAAFGDLAGIDKSLDPRRVRYLKNLVADLMNEQEAHGYQNLQTCLRPTTPDDMPIIGALKFYPNVYVNGGHSGRGTTYGIATSKIVSEMIMDGKVSIIEDPSPYSPKRFKL